MVMQYVFGYIFWQCSFMRIRQLGAKKLFLRINIARKVTRR